MKLITLRDKSPLVTFRLVFRTGAAADPIPGIARLTTQMLANGSTTRRTYKEIVDALFPMAISVESTVDKEMCALVAETHRDNLEAFTNLFCEMVLEPGWREEDFTRLRDEAENHLAVTLRGQNDEELAKEALYLDLYPNHPYGWHNAGTVESLGRITLADLQAFYRTHFTQTNLTVGLAGGFPDGFDLQLLKRLEALPTGQPTPQAVPAPSHLSGGAALIIEKPCRSVAISLGHAIDVKRGHPDYVPLLLATSALGQHRMSSGRLFTRMRQLRGLNYGDYTYIEYFPSGMYSLEPEPNLARTHQIFQLWIRPVERDQAVFALRLGLYELERWIRDGITEEEFIRTRSFLSKYVNLLLKTKSAELGYAIDSDFYGIPTYPAYIRQSLAKLTRDQVNQAIQQHIHQDQVRITLVTEEAQALKAALLSGAPTPMTYNAPKPPDLLAEDQIIERYPLPIREVVIRPVTDVFEVPIENC